MFGPPRLTLVAKANFSRVHIAKVLVQIKLIVLLFRR